MLARVATSVFTISIVFSGCGPAPPPPTTGADSSAPLLSDTKMHVETSSAVMPPGISSSCSDGRVFVVYGRQYGASRMSSTDLSCYLNGTPNCFQSQPLSELTSDTFKMSNVMQWNGSGLPQNFACHGKLAPLQTVQRHIVWYTDSLITRVGQKDLLHIYLTMANHPPKSAVPNRLDSTLPAGCNNPFTTASLAVVKSNDCG